MRPISGGDLDAGLLDFGKLLVFLLAKTSCASIRLRPCSLHGSRLLLFGQAIPGLLADHVHHRIVDMACQGKMVLHFVELVVIDDADRISCRSTTP
jgi:hypothetical protein